MCLKQEIAVVNGASPDKFRHRVNADGENNSMGAMSVALMVILPICDCITKCKLDHFLTTMSKAMHKLDHPLSQVPVTPSYGVAAATPANEEKGSRLYFHSRECHR